MAVAYRHQGLGSPVQVMHFLSQRLAELQEAISRWKDENEMWTVVDQLPGLAVPADARGLLRVRQRVLVANISAAETELGAMRRLYDAFHPCPTCNGLGKVSVDQDGKLETCSKCGGSGTHPSTQ